MITQPLCKLFFFSSFYIRITNSWFIKQIRIAYTRISIYALIERATHIYTQHTRARVPYKFLHTRTNCIRTYIHSHYFSSLFVCCLFFAYRSIAVRDLRRNRLFFLIFPCFFFFCLFLVLNFLIYRNKIVPTIS